MRPFIPLCVGDSVRVIDPDDYVSSVKSKVAGGRVGYVRHVFDRSRSCVVLFPASGRRKEFRSQFQMQWLVRVADLPGGDA